MEKKRTTVDFLQSDAELPLHVVYQQMQENVSEFKNMWEICLTVEDFDNQRIAMEYLYTNGFYDKLQMLIDKNIQSANRLNRKTARMYQLLRERKTTGKRQDRMKLLQTANRLRLAETDYELHILRDLLHIYCYFDMNQYGKIGGYNDHIKELLPRVSDPLLKKLFTLRLHETLFIYHWKRNEMLLSRKYAYQLLKEINNPIKKVDLHNLLAQGYLFDSFDQANLHVIEAMDIAKQIQYERGIYGLKNYTLPFIAAYHRKTEGIETEDKAEQAHIALAEGNSALCIKILENFEEHTPFQQYYLGKAKQDKVLLRISYQRFVEERDDYFYARLPLEELNALDQQKDA